MHTIAASFMHLRLGGLAILILAEGSPRSLLLDL